MLKNKTIRYNDNDLSLMRNTFAGDDTVLYAIRKFMFGMELTEGEQKFIGNLTDEMKTLIRKVFLPQIDGEAPLFQLFDMTLALKEEMKGKSYEEQRMAIEIKALEMDYINQRLDLMEGIQSTEKELSLVNMADLNSDNAVVNISARNYLLSYIDSFCNEMRLFGNQKDKEEIKDTATRLAQDSTK